MRSGLSNRACIAASAFAVFTLLSLLALSGAAAALAAAAGWVVIFVLSLASSSLLFFFMANGLASRRLREYGQGIDLHTSRIVDLRVRLAVYKHFELSYLGKSFNVLLAKIHAVIFRLKSIARRGAEIGGELAAGSEEIAASVEESARTVESISGNSRALARGRSPRAVRSGMSPTPSTASSRALRPGGA